MPKKSKKEQEEIVELTKKKQYSDCLNECFFFLGSNDIPRISYKGHKLSKQQVVILELIAHGYNNTEISNAMILSPRTVETHVSNIRKILSKDKQLRIGDRKLVLCAKEMLDGYQNYLRQRFAQSYHM